MKIKNLLITLSLIFLASACVNGTTITGNPPTIPLPEAGDGIDGGNGGGNNGGGTVATDLAASTKAFIEGHSLWKSDSSSREIPDYFVEFAKESYVDIYSIIKNEHVSLKYTIRPDGSVITEHANDIASVIGYQDETDGEEINLVIKLISNSRDVLADLLYTDSEEDKVTFSLAKQCVLLVQCDQEKLEEIKDNAPGGKFGALKERDVAKYLHPQIAQ